MEVDILGCSPTRWDRLLAGYASFEDATSAQLFDEGLERGRLGRCDFVCGIAHQFPGCGFLGKSPNWTAFISLPVRFFNVQVKG